MLYQDEDSLSEGKIGVIMRKTRINSKTNLTRFTVGVDYSRMRLYDVKGEPILNRG